MAEIRRMLDDLKGDGNASEASPPPGRDVAGIDRMAPAPAQARRSTDDVDPLREKLRESDQRGRRGAQDSDAQRAGLMRRHQKRTRRRRMAEQTRKSRGGFYTGLTLVLLVAGMLAGTYSFSNVIVDRFPGAAPAIAQYREVIDEWMGEAQQVWNGVEQRIGELSEELFAE
ncbi:MAG: hypothetical protein AAF677_12155 [Pseudomonadota bacterium]